MSVHSINLKHSKQLSEKLKELRTQHILWLKSFNKRLVCKIYDYQFNMNHTSCSFGNWFYSVQDAELLGNPDFQIMGDIHETLHHKALHIFNKHLERQDVLEYEFDDLIQSEAFFLHALDTLLNAVNTTIHSIDVLTLLPNRSLFYSILEREHAKLNKESENDCIVFADIDHFKKINDTYGHITGDEVLKEFSDRISMSLRKKDIVGRFGGEEFIIFLPQTPISQAKIAVERIRSAIEKTNFEISQQKEVSITCSFGLASFSSESKLNTIIENADKAMYSAKKNGRNRVEVFS